MDVQLKNGVGTGHRLKIDTKNRLQSFSTSHGLSYDAAVDGRAFILRLADTTVTIGTSSDWMIHIANNDPNRNLIIERILGTVTGGAQFQLMANADVTTIGNANASIEPVNLNLGSAVQPVADVSVWDGTTGNGLSGLSGGDIVAPLLVPGATVLDLLVGEDWLIPNGSSLSVKATSLSGSISLGMVITFFWLDIEI